MSTKDISRFLFQPQKHYSGVRMQQGRVILDSDFNEEARLDEEELRRALADVIGPKGTPDAGFSFDLRVGDQLSVLGNDARVRELSFGNGRARVFDYRIRPGSFYLGGMRFDVDEPGESIALQRDWLQLDLAHAAPARGENTRHFALLRGWEQCVSAAEDAEILERALGGPDTSVRVRRMRRVEVIAGVKDEQCGAALVSYVAASEPGRSYNVNTCELESNGRLWVDFQPGPSSDTCGPCDPSPAGRYLGAENQAIRVMQASRDSFVWAYDNGAPLYRVRITNGNTVQMLTPPKDQAHWPIKNRVVELLPWGAVLPNGQKVADGSVGVFTRVVSEFRVDDDKPSFEIDPAGAFELGRFRQSWDAAHPNATDLNHHDDGPYLYMRAWHRVAHDADRVTIPLSSAAPLGDTGIVLRFAQAGAPGDYWTIAVRPETPDEIVPWEMRNASAPVAPHGPRIYLAPLALIDFRWDAAINSLTVTRYEDCRPRFRPLTRASGCCTVSVGDGIRSHGDFRTLQEAVDSLPSEGGKVCVLRGDHFGEVRIIGRKNVVIEGCGIDSVLRSRELFDGSTRGDALVHIEDGSTIELRHLRIRARGQFGVLGQRLNVRSQFVDLLITCEDDPQAGIPAHAALQLEEVDWVHVKDCAMELPGGFSGHAVLTVQGNGILIEDNLISARPHSPEAAWGGIHVGGGTTGVVIRDNRIFGGLGHGITLGGIEWTSSERPNPSSTPSSVGRLRFAGLRVFPAALGIISRAGKCGELDPVIVGPVPHPRNPGITLIPELDEPLDDILIEGNLIAQVGSNGISPIATIFPQFRRDVAGGRLPIDVVELSNLVIRNNRIREHAQLISSRTQILKEAATELRFGEVDLSSANVTALSYLVYGGISLGIAQHVTIHDNHISGGGTSNFYPQCGIYVLAADNLRIDDNHIVDNGEHLQTAVAGGIRGGVVVTLAGLGLATLEGAADEDAARDPSIAMRNNVVSQPEGPALQVVGVGPMLFQGNFLSSRGNNGSYGGFTLGHNVTIINMGALWETRGPMLFNQASFVPSMTRVLLEDRSRKLDGRILFHDNQVTLNWPDRVERQAEFAVALITQGDLSVVGNQFAARLPGATPLSSRFRFAFVQTKAADPSTGTPALLAHVLAWGATVVASNNRIAEGLDDAFASLYCLGGFASVTGNILTHCPAYQVIRLLDQNLVLAEPPGGCGNNKSEVS